MQVGGLSSWLAGGSSAGCVVTGLNQSILTFTVEMDVFDTTQTIPD